MGIPQVPTVMLDASLFYLLGGIVLVGVIALLYTRFYKERDTGGTDELNWVNKSNYNISTDDATAEAAENATPAEARVMTDNIKKGGDGTPPSEEVFHDLNAKLGGAGDTAETKSLLNDPDAKPRRV